MNEPRNYPDVIKASDEAEAEDALAGHAPPEGFGIALARRLNSNPEFRAWAKVHVTVTDLDGNCPTCHGRGGCADCMNEDDWRKDR